LTRDVAGYLVAVLFAGVAQLVEHHLAKVDVESSSLFARSIFPQDPAPEKVAGFFVSEIRAGF
jgi:hypothetical protein